uniref:SPK domain-containing protein n=1 Tax=Caenorhabditis tropicalis TaxID=1561998 RepID=A0A1I7UU73_9PELO
MTAMQKKEKRIRGLIKTIAKTHFTKPADLQELSQKGNWGAKSIKKKIRNYLKHLESVRYLEMRDIVHVIYVLGLSIGEKSSREITSTPGPSFKPDSEEEEEDEEIPDDEDGDISEGNDVNEDGNDFIDGNDLIDENDIIIKDERMEEVQDTVLPPPPPEDVKPDNIEPALDAIRILQSLSNMVFILREPMLKGFEDTVSKELENRRRRDTKILEADFVQSIEMGLRILANGSTNQQDQDGLMKLEAILKPLTLQLLNLGFRHDSPLVEQMMAETSKGKWIPIRKVNNVLVLLFEAATPAI